MMPVSWNFETLVTVQRVIHESLNAIRTIPTPKYFGSVLRRKKLKTSRREITIYHRTISFPILPLLPTRCKNPRNFHPTRSTIQPEGNLAEASRKRCFQYTKCSVIQFGMAALKFAGKTCIATRGAKPPARGCQHERASGSHRL